MIVGLPVSVTDDVADMCLFGDERQVAAQLRRFADVGATEVSAFPIGDPATQARTLEVLAALGSLSATA